MSDLRKAAKQALEVLETTWGQRESNEKTI
jgi:hypothetical protein